MEILKKMLLLFGILNMTACGIPAIMTAVPAGEIKVLNSLGQPITSATVQVFGMPNVGALEGPLSTRTTNEAGQVEFAQRFMVGMKWIVADADSGYGRGFAFCVSKAGFRTSQPGFPDAADHPVSLTITLEQGTSSACQLED